MPLPADGRLSLPDVAIYVAAALAEIGGCFAFWRWLRDGASPWWVLPGLLSLAAFAALLTRIGTDAAGRAYAAYGGIYIAASVIWLLTVEGVRPTAFDLAGAALAVLGTLVILYGAYATR